MKTIGLLGGMSWESTDLYYQQLNKSVQQKLGKLHSAKIVLISVNFAEIEILQRQGLWDDAALYLKEKAIQLEKAGAEGILLCTNTMHKVASAIESSVSVPFIHIADATAKEVLNQNIGKVGLLGTQFTMEQGFYKHRLEEQGINVLVPNQAHRQMVHNIIYDELCLGVIKEESRQKYIHIVEQLILEGAEGIILGCTEICMLIGDTQFSVPLFDTTSIHVQAAVDFALS